MLRHLILSLVGRVLYGLRVVGRHYVPPTGPALLLSNHVSYLDGFFILAASPRPVRFLIDAEFVNQRWYGFILRGAGAIPVPRGGGPKAIRAVLQAATDALKAGDAVALFPESRPTRCGAMLPFQRGFERIARDANAPIIPVWLDGLYGSVFSYASGRLFGSRPKRLRYAVSVAFGPALPSTTEAAPLRAIIQRMGADRAIARTRLVRPLHRQFVRMAARHPFRPCLIDTTKTPPQTLNYAAALTAAVCLRAWLKPRLGDSKMVGVWLPSSVGGALANIALCVLGKTAVNLNYTAGADAVTSAVEQCGIRRVVTSRKFLAKLPFDVPGVEVIALEDAAPAIPKWRKLLAYAATIALPGWALDAWLGLTGHGPGDLATVIFSSGSMGQPKGVMLTYANVTSNVEAFHEHAQFTKRDRALGVLPFFHSFGYTVTLWGPLTVGGSAVYHPDPRAAKEVGELARTHKPTLIAATATFLRFYLRRCEKDDFRSLRLLVCGAEKLPPPLIAEFAEKFGVEPLEGYGCTELSPVVSVNMPEREVGGVTQRRKKVGTIGHTLPGIAAKVCHPDTGDELPLGSEGLLWIKGPNVLSGYLGRPDLYAKAVVDGWYCTGDMATLDDEGFLTITGRLARFAKIGGEMVPLERLEDELHKLMGTTDRVLAVSAVPDPKKGERLVVLHLPLPEGHTPKSLSDGLSDRGLPNLWVPGERDFFAIAEMPVLGSGKLDLQKLRQVATAAAERVS